MWRSMDRLLAICLLLGSIILLSYTLRTADSAMPMPMPTVDGCNIFAELHPSVATDVQSLPNLPIVNRPYRHAVHTLFIDETILHHAQAVGFDTVVQVLPWRDVNPAAGVWQWGTADALVQETLPHDLNLVLRLDMPPEWASDPDAFGLPFSAEKYAEFVERVGRRYAGHVLGYIIWNEPNLAAEWSFSGENLERQLEIGGGWVAYPPNYAGLLGLAHARLQSADPHALVIAAGLAPTNETSPRAMDDRLFLQQFFAAQGHHCFDVLAIHAYGYGQDPLAETNNGNLNLSRLNDYHTILHRHQVTQPLWVTELGYTVNRGTQPTVTLQQQTDYLPAALERIEQSWPSVKLITVWNLSYGLAADDEIEGYSLLTNGVEQRPIYGALQAYLENKK